MTVHLRETRSPAVVSIKSTDIVATGRSYLYASFGKRALDMTFVLLAAPFALTLIAIGAVLAMTTGGKPFYRQKRLGQDGRVFHLIKIRTMVPAAEAVLERYLESGPAARAEWDAKQKLANDPRITAVGHFLRRTSLDELPQLLNVLKGDMSIVGPRPMMVDQAMLYPGREYYALRPGITGPWQVSDRSQGNFADRAYHDRQYFLRVSLAEDMRLLWKTVGAVEKCTGR